MAASSFLSRRGPPVEIAIALPDFPATRIEDSSASLTRRRGGRQAIAPPEAAEARCIGSGRERHRASREALRTAARLQGCLAYAAETSVLPGHRGEKGHAETQVDANSWSRRRTPSSGAGAS